MSALRTSPPAAGAPAARTQAFACAAARIGARGAASCAGNADASRVATPVVRSCAALRSELLLNSSSVLVLASLLDFRRVARARGARFPALFSDAPCRRSGTRPSGLGVQKFMGSGALGLCPRTPNCISTAEEANDPAHFVPPWTYNPEESKRGRNPVSQEQAMQELVAAVKASSPDGFTPTIVKQEEDYLYVEYQSPLFGFVDDVEFYFPGGPGSRVEYRSASRMGNTDGDINRKRIKALREALQKSGWKSIGY